MEEHSRGPRWGVPMSHVDFRKLPISCPGGGGGGGVTPIFFIKMCGHSYQ